MPSVLVKDLPQSLQRALESISYHKKDIDFEVKDQVSLQVVGGAGQRGFAIIVNLATGEREQLNGSWGGSNPFTPTNRIDNDSRTQTLGQNVVVIKGSAGAYIYAHMYIGTANIIPILPTAEELPLKSRQILYCYRALKSGPYRKDELNRIKATETEIDALVESKYLKKDGRGIQITVEGKNALGDSLSMPREEVQP